MVKRWLLIPMVMALGTGVAVTPDSDRRTVAGLEQATRVAEITMDRCIRACLACDQGNVLSCTICVMCSEPAIAAMKC